MNYLVHNKREAEEALAYLIEEHGASFYLNAHTFMNGFREYSYHGYVYTETSITFGTKLKYADIGFNTAKIGEQPVNWTYFRNSIDVNKYFNYRMENNMKKDNINYRVYNKQEVEEIVGYLVNKRGAKFFVNKDRFMNGFEKYGYDGFVGVTLDNNIQYANNEYSPSAHNEKEVEWSDFRQGLELSWLVEGETTGDAVHKPSHYQLEDGTEVKDHIRSLLGDEGFKSYAIGNAIKYIGRYADKENPKQDLQKSQEYLDMVIEVLEGED